MNFYERANSSIPIHYRSVRCLGEERNLTDCPGISEITTSCSHNQDAYIVCRPSSFDISRKSHSHLISYPLLLCFNVCPINLHFSVSFPYYSPLIPMSHSCTARHSLCTPPCDICVAVGHFPASVKLLFLPVHVTS